jgi:hypothetical protein
MCLQFSVYLWVRLLGFCVSRNGMYWSFTVHVCGIVSTVTIWQYGHLLYFTHLLALCVFVTKEILLIILVHECAYTLVVVHAGWFVRCEEF